MHDPGLGRATKQSFDPWSTLKIIASVMGSCRQVQKGIGVAGCLFLSFTGVALKAVVSADELYGQEDTI